MTDGHGSLGGGVETAAVYSSSGAYSPRFQENARAALWLLFRARADLWHFVFAPNPRTSTVGRLSKRLRRIPVVQTVASPPATFSPDLFFGDHVVAQSEWTRSRILAAFRGAGLPAPRLSVILPPMGDVVAPDDERKARVRAALELEPGARVFVYPGDLEVSRGAETVAAAVPSITERVRGAVVVYACRKKTPAAPRIEEQLRARLSGLSVRFAQEIDLPALLSLATAVLFPVDDLRGKVDIPISLLEAMSLGVPVITLTEGPPSELEGALRVASGDAEALSDLSVRLAAEPAFALAVATRAHEALAQRHGAALVAAAYERIYDELLAR